VSLFRCGLILSLAALSQAFSQNAKLSGEVIDATGASMSDALIRLVQESTGVRLQTTTTRTGSFLFSSVPAGNYALECESKGFRKLVRPGLVLEVASSQRLVLRMEIGRVEEAIEVSEQEARVYSTAQTVAGEVTRDQIASLPLNSRDFNQLVLLAAGAVENINAGNGRDFGAVAANGNRSFSNDYTIDGAPNNDLYQGLAALPLSIDVIQEFKVTSGAAPAQYGQAGTQVTIVTRSGGNRFHGSLFEYQRSEFLQARNAFSNINSLPAFSRHQFGGSLGGPVVRNRTFFFVNYEGNRQREAATRVSTVPPDAFWRGDFSELLDRRISLRDPLLPDRPPIPGNRLDQYLGGARLSKAARQLQPFWGSPNVSGLTNNRIVNASSRADNRQFTARGDHSLPRNQQISLRLSASLRDAFSPNLTGNGSGLVTPTNNWNAAVNWTVPWTAHLLQESRFSAADFDSLTLYSNATLPTVESLGMQGFTAVSDVFPPLPRIQFAGGDAFTQLNYGSSANFGMAALIRKSRTFNYASSLSWSIGSHTIKSGIEMRRTSLPALQTTNARGSLSFTASATGISTGYAFADFLIGLPSSTQEVPVRPELLLRQNDIATYLQDDWRLSRRLTVYLGLRHELYFAPSEDKNRITTFDPSINGIVVASSNGKLPVEQYVPAVVSKLATTGAWPFPVVAAEQAGLNASRLVNTQYKNFAPRAGFAYDVSGSGTRVIRAGYGMFYTRYPIQYLQQTSFVNPPFAGVFNYNQALQNARPLLTLEAPFPASGGSPSVAPAGIERNFLLPNNQQWNLTIEQALGGRTSISLGYAGNKGTHLFRTINLNGPRLDEQGRIVRPYQNTFGTSAIAYRVTNGNSIYHAMLLEARRKAARDLFFQANWTYANGMDDTGQTVNNALLDVQNLGRDRARSDYVRRHQVTINATYRLPRAGPGQLLAGWRLSGLYRFTTGRYFTPSFTTTGGLSNNRPDVVAGVRADLRSGERSALRWFNPAAFATVPAVDPVSGLPRFGNAGRNILTGPGLSTMDASLSRIFRLKERWDLTFRMEAFNALNQVNYDLPDSNISNGNIAGSISQTVTPARQVQFAIRLDF
jgi:hypothetical protein